MILCYEDRDEWAQSSQIPLASEAARWLAPKADVDLAANLVSVNGMEVVRLPLTSTSRSGILTVLKQHPAQMLWNVTDGLTVFCGSLIPSLAKIIKVPALGSDTYVQGMCQNKHHWKAVLGAHGLPCLPGVVVRQDDHAEVDRIKDLKLPLFVKAATYGNNAGFSVVDPIAMSHDEAAAKTRQLLAGGLGPILVEEYAAGTEYSVWCFET